MRWLIGLVFLFASCQSGVSFSGEKDLHEAYGNSLVKAGLDETVLGKRWFTSAEEAFAKPHQVTVPYKEAGYFAADEPRAASIRFAVKRGQKLIFEIRTNPASFRLFTDLWEVGAEGSPKRIRSGDTSLQNGLQRFEEDIDADAVYLLRLQPQLLSSGDYTLSISTAASLGFPVAGKASVQSFWGVDRDGGARRHEGIDIFAPKRAPAIAAADGRVSSVTENRLGGLVVFMRPGGKNYSLYYAHLDKQLVSPGQQVKKGDTIGLVGNTGNARTTPPHLHFGIYTVGGAIDPFPFVNPAIGKAPEPVLKPDASRNVRRLISEQELRSAAGNASARYAANTILFIQSAETRMLHVKLPDENLSAVPYSETEDLGSPLRSTLVKDVTHLFDAPSRGAAKKQPLAALEKISVYGYFDNYAFVETSKDTRGWVMRSLLE